MNKNDVWAYIVLSNREEMQERLKELKTKAQREDFAKWISHRALEIWEESQKEAQQQMRIALGINNYNLNNYE